MQLRKRKRVCTAGGGHEWIWILGKDIWMLIEAYSREFQGKQRTVDVLDVFARPYTHFYLWLTHHGSSEITLLCEEYPSDNVMWQVKLSNLQSMPTRINSWSAEDFLRLLDAFVVVYSRRTAQLQLFSDAKTVAFCCAVEDVLPCFEYEGDYKLTGIGLVQNVRSVGSVSVLVSYNQQPLVIQIIPVVTSLALPATTVVICDSISPIWMVLCLDAAKNIMSADIVHQLQQDTQDTQDTQETQKNYTQKNYTRCQLGFMTGLPQYDFYTSQLRGDWFYFEKNHIVTAYNWKTRQKRCMNLHTSFSPPSRMQLVVFDSFLFIATTEHLHLLDRESLEIRQAWRERTRSSRSSSDFYVQADHSLLRITNTSTGRTLWRWDVIQSRFIPFRRRLLSADIHLTSDGHCVLLNARARGQLAISHYE